MNEPDTSVDEGWEELLGDEAPAAPLVVQPTELEEAARRGRLQVPGPAGASPPPSSLFGRSLERRKTGPFTFVAADPHDVEEDGYDTAAALARLIERQGSDTGVEITPLPPVSPEALEDHSLSSLTAALPTPTSSERDSPAPRDIPDPIATISGMGSIAQASLVQPTDPGKPTRSLLESSQLAAPSQRLAPDRRLVYVTMVVMTMALVAMLYAL